MLSELYIRNFAIIDDLRLQFDAGFNVLTGETGAGKSIILDAVMLVLGGRSDTTMVRAGCEQAFVEATFRLDDQLRAQILPLLQAEGLDDDEEFGDEIVLARELRVNGRNIVRVNGRSINLTLLRDIAAPLIDIHGQGDHLSLLKPRSHLPLLDAYARLEKAQKAFAHEVSKLSLIQRELQGLRQDERILAQRIDMLQFQIQEIDAAKLKPGEEDELRVERERLANAEHLTRAATEAVAAMTGVDDEGQNVVDLLGQAERALSQLTRFDETQNTRLETLQGLAFQVSELAGELQLYLDELEFNPERLNQVEERLELINLLKRKYGADILAILALRDKAAVELEQITHSEERIAQLEKEQTAMLRHLGKLAQALSQKRQEAAVTLSRSVEEHLAELSMAGARFSVSFTTEPDANGLFVGEERFAFDQTGYDQVEFLISTNPGEPMKPMAKVASGGETARLMLAMKTALAEVDATPTLIFDEIDQGIGGRVGDIVGRKLWGLTAVANHQVIVVTHLPQLAGYGDAHFHVSKRQRDERTTTAVETLDRNGRITELAAMLGTQAQHARDGAASILDLAHTAKQSALKRTV
ncbi:MAG: DNA repair protein RecN [Anaerolineales bacterium]|nr:DNA repair protein RecN [Anaerolineales bacterium]